MSSPVLIEFESHRSQPFLVRDVLPGSGWASYKSKGLAIVGNPDCLPIQVAIDGSCLKGMLVALAMESVVGLAILGVWQLLHVVR